MFNIFLYPSFTNLFGLRIFFPYIIPLNISQIIDFSENILGNPELSKDFRLIQGTKNLRILAGEFGQEAPSPRARSAAQTQLLQKRRKLTEYSAN